MAENEMVRVNTRISKTLNDWLDEESKRTGLSKSALIMLAGENYMREKVAMEMMTDIGTLWQKLDEVQQAVERNDRN